MEFPITELLDNKACEEWLISHFHPQGFRCANCGSEREQAHPFRQTRRSHLQTYRCNECGQTYNLYSRTIFEQRHLTPRQVVLLVRGIVKGEPSTTLAAELGINYNTVLDLRHDLQDNARRQQPNSRLSNNHSETHEMFQGARKKGSKHRNPLDPPRRRANNRRGRGTYANDRPPIVGTIGRQTGQVRLRVTQDTTGETLCAHAGALGRVSHKLAHNSIPMKIRVTSMLFATTLPSAMPTMSMLVTTASGKPIVIPLKVCEPMFATSFVHSKESTKSI